MGKKIELYDYQVTHAASLAKIVGARGAAGDLSDTGTGKTYAACGVAQIMGLKLFVIAARNSARTWFDVAVQTRSPFFFSGGWEEARTKGFRWNVFKRSGPGGDFVDCEWRVPAGCLLVFDEAHRGKGDDTMNSFLVQGARGNPTLLLSASLAASAAQMRASGYTMGLHNLHDFGDFKQLYKGVEGVAALHKRIFDPLEPYAARLRTADIPGFPKNNVFPVLVEVDDPDQLSKWRAETTARADQLEGEGKRDAAIVARLRYRQAAELRRLPAMLERTKDAVEEGNSVVLFFCFRETLFQAMKVLGDKAVPLYGTQPKDQGAESVRAFQENRKFIIAVTHGTGSESIGLHDLHGRPRVSLISPPESGFQLKQCLGRTPRNGALSPAMQYICYARGVEEDVYASVSHTLKKIGVLNDGA